MSVFKKADLNKWRAALDEAAQGKEITREIFGIKIPALGLAGDDPAPRILPPHQNMILVQSYDPQMTDMMEAIQDDLAHGVEGIWVSGTDKKIPEIINKTTKYKPVIYVDDPVHLSPKNNNGNNKNIAMLLASEETNTAADPATDLAAVCARALAFKKTSPAMPARLGLKADQNIFITIAKYRAARWLWFVLTGETASIHALPCTPSNRTDDEAGDEGAHLLHNVVGCFAAAVGGAQSITLPPYAHKDSHARHFHARRGARNIWHVLREEGHLNRVVDPAAGSWLAENLTVQIAEKAWALFANEKLKLNRPKDNHSGSETITDTPEEIKLKSIYGPQDAPDIDFTLPGQPPFTRGPYAAMFLTRPWTIRQYAGFSTAEDSNRFYRHALAHGQKGLSVAFDLPTHRGYDSDSEHAAADVGMAGVAIDCLDDMRILFDQIPLGEVSVSMTMNGAVLPIMALYIAAAAEQNVQPEQLAGTIQNDILKEFMVRNTYIYPPAASLRIVSDIFAYAAEHMPKFNTISISGYHMQEAGATKDLELAYTLADGMEYVRAGIKAGLDIDNFAPRLSFFWCIGMDFFMEVAKMRAARRLWAEIMADFGAKKEKSLALRTHCQTSGWSLTARDPFNNVARTCLEASAAIYGGTQSLHTNALDEALALPSDFSAKIARDTQLFLQNETDMCASIDPWGGSYYVERLTEKIAERAREHIKEIENVGGMAAALAEGLPKMRIEEAATRAQAHIDTGQRVIIGVNKFQTNSEPEIDILKVDNLAVRKNQIARLKEARRRRDQKAVAAQLEALYQAAETGGDNLMAACVEAAKAGATVGEMSLALERAFTRHKAKARITKGIYASAAKSDKVRHARQVAQAFAQKRGSPPCILIAKAGQDGHDRGQKVIAGAYADMGFDVHVGDLFCTADEVAAQAMKLDVDIVAISSLAGAHLPLARELILALDAKDRSDIAVVIGGIIPKDDVAPLKEAGVKAVYPPGTDVSASAIDLLELIRGKN